MIPTYQRQSTDRTDDGFRDPDGILEHYTWPGVDMIEPDHIEVGERVANALGVHDIYREREINNA